MVMRRSPAYACGSICRAIKLASFWTAVRAGRTRDGRVEDEEVAGVAVHSSKSLELRNPNQLSPIIPHAAGRAWIIRAEVVKAQVRLAEAGHRVRNWVVAHNVSLGVSEVGIAISRIYCNRTTYGAIFACARVDAFRSSTHHTVVPRDTALKLHCNEATVGPRQSKAARQALVAENDESVQRRVEAFFFQINNLGVVGSCLHPAAVHLG